MTRPPQRSSRLVGSESASNIHTLILPPSRWPRLDLGELWRFRAICLVLARRLLKVRYRQTVIGVGWTVLQPLSLMVVFTIFFGVFGRYPSEDVPYPVFVYAGLLLWQVVNKVLTEGSNSIVNDAGLVTKIYFPRAYFPGAVALSSLVDLVFSLLAMAVLLVAYRIVPGIEIAVLPVAVAVAMAAVLGVTLWLSALNVAYRDVGHLLPFLSQLWLFLSPVIYPSSIVPPQFQTIYYLNPLAVSIDAFRWGLTGAPPPPPEAWVAGGLVSAGLLVSGYVFFRRREASFADDV